MANIEPPTHSIARLAPASAGIFSRCSGTSGAEAKRVSMTRKAAISTAEITRAVIVWGEPHPTVSVRTRP